MGPKGNREAKITKKKHKSFNNFVYIAKYDTKRDYNKNRTNDFRHTINK